MSGPRAPGASAGPGPAAASGPTMERPPRGVAATVLGLLLLLAMAGLSRVPWTAAEDPDGLLRLSWRFQGRMGERCRTPSAEELAELPVHMRNPDACRQEGVAYRLRVTVDDAVRVDRVLEPAGARGDRPVYVLDELELEPGTHRVGVTFEADGAEGGEAAGTDARRAGRAAAGESDVPPGGRAGEPAGLRWSGTVEVEPGRVLLVTRDPDTGRLELRDAPPTGR